MSNIFIVTSAQYDGTAPAPTAPGQANPIVVVIGTVNGVFSIANCFYDQIEQAFAVGGSSAVQSVLAPLLYAYVSQIAPAAGVTPGAPASPIIYSATVPSPTTGTPGTQNTSLSAALVSSWVA